MNTDVKTMTTDVNNSWPPRPEGEVFPALLDTLLVAQLLLYDRRGMTPEQARRNVRKLVKDAGLPTLGRIGSSLMYDKAAVLGWLGQRGSPVDSSGDGPDDRQSLEDAGAANGRL